MDSIHVNSIPSIFLNSECSISGAVETGEPHLLEAAAVIPSKNGFLRLAHMQNFNSTEHERVSGIEWECGHTIMIFYLQETKNPPRLCTRAKSRMRLVRILSNVQKIVWKVVPAEQTCTDQPRVKNLNRA
jgi:hypothetical protein